MVSWLTVPSVPMPDEMSRAERTQSRRTRIDRYRSRTEVTIEHINAALAWLRLSRINGEELEQNPYQEMNTLYKVLPIQRGISPEEALNKVQEQLYSLVNNSYPLNIITFNTGTAAAASEAVKNWLDRSADYTELDVAAMCTTTPTHKPHIYKHVGNQTNHTIFVILNNLDTPTVLFKMMTAIMLNLILFGEQTTTFAEAWLNGNADAVYTAVGNYYAEYKSKTDARRRAKALEELSKTMVVDRTNEFRTRITQLEHNIASHFVDINELNDELNKVKGEYLLYTLTDQEDKSEELKAFFESCGDKIAYINFNENRLYIVYRTALIYYEPDMLRRYFESNRGNCVTNAPMHIQQLLKDVFLDNKYTLLIETGACLDVRNNRIQFADPTSLMNKSRETLAGLLNPHHYYYNCWGDNQSLIVRALMDKDYIKAILTAFAAMSGLNISDTAVMEKLIREEFVYFPDTPCLKNNETGEIITINQYKRRLEDNASDETDE